MAKIPLTVVLFTIVLFKSELFQSDSTSALTVYSKKCKMFFSQYDICYYRYSRVNYSRLMAKKGVYSHDFLLSSEHDVIRHVQEITVEE